jgi:PiT family inorganic phosphate transporter
VLGPVVVVLVLAALSTYMWLRSRRHPVGAGNVNDEWQPTVQSVEMERVS